MPIYDFRCNRCGQTFEIRQSMNALPPVCPDCGDRTQRWIGSAPALHGAATQGREQAARSLPRCGKGCRCCP